MKKVFKKKVLSALLAFCLCLVMLPTTAYAEDRHVTMDAAEGFTLSASQNSNCCIDVAKSGGGGDTIAFKDENGNDISNASITVSDGKADIVMPEGVKFKLAFHYDFMCVRLNGEAITADTVMNSSDNISLRVEPLNNSGNSNPGQDPPSGGGRLMQQVDLKITDDQGNSFPLNYVDGPVYSVPQEFNLEKFDIEVIGITTYEADNDGNPITQSVFTEYDDQGFHTGAMIDDEGRDAFQIMNHYTGTNVKQFGVEFHADNAANTKGFPGFYVFQITLQKPAYTGVTILQDNVKVPDYYDFATYNKVDLAETSQSNAGVLSTYYGNDVIALASDLPERQITGIEPYDLPAGAVTVDVANRTVKVNSPYFDRIPLKITSTDSSGASVTGYMIINITGIEARFMGKGNTHSFHGASGWGPDFPAENQGKGNWVATFYQDVDVADGAYELVALLTYSDGSTETVQVKTYGSGKCHDERLKGCDYILWSGDDEADAAPVKVSITAVKAGSMTGSTFNGCSFGSGAGVTVAK